MRQAWRLPYSFTPYLNKTRCGVCACAPRTGVPCAVCRWFFSNLNTPLLRPPFQNSKAFLNLSRRAEFASYIWRTRALWRRLRVVDVVFPCELFCLAKVVYYRELNQQHPTYGLGKVRTTSGSETTRRTEERTTKANRRDGYRVGPCGSGWQVFHSRVPPLPVPRRRYNRLQPPRPYSAVCKTCALHRPVVVAHHAPKSVATCSQAHASV